MKGREVSFQDGRLDFTPARRDVPIYVASQRAGGCRVAGRLADGAIMQGAVADPLVRFLRETVHGAARDAGRVLNANLTDYKMPTAVDVPRVESILVQHPSLVGPFGAKGVGEPPNIEPPAAVANAVAAATGLRVTSLPITAEKIALGLADARAT